MLQNLWGRPPGLRGTPRSPPVEARPCTRRWPTRASAADEGVRPTIYADVRLWENYVALPLRSRLVGGAALAAVLAAMAQDEVAQFEAAVPRPFDRNLCVVAFGIGSGDFQVAGGNIALVSGEGECQYDAVSFPTSHTAS